MTGIYHWYTIFPMTKKLMKVGNTQAIVIDKPIMDLLGITMETELEIRTDGRGLFIQPVLTEEERKRRVLAAWRKVMVDHGETLKKLAE